MFKLGKLELALAASLVIGVVLIRRNLTDVVAGGTQIIVGAAGDAIGGVAIGVGDVLGIPRTDESECQKAMREGRSWDASFACPASTFLDYMVHGYIDPNNKGLQ